MVEKWLQSKPNPWLSKKRRTIIPFGLGNSPHYGKPAKLFADNDKDRVPNVFDCKPFNRKKQDVMSPLSGSNPMQEMHYRQETARQQMEYQKYLRQMQKLEEDRLAELQRLSTPTIISEPQIIDRTITNWYPYDWNAPVTTTPTPIQPSSTSTTAKTTTVSGGSYNPLTGVYTSPTGVKQSMASAPTGAKVGLTTSSPVIGIPSGTYTAPKTSTVVSKGPIATPTKSTSILGSIGSAIKSAVTYVTKSSSSKK